MNERQWSAVDAYFTDTIVEQDGALEAALAANAAVGLPRIDVSPPHGKLLYLLARISGAVRALEIGTLGGYSTIGSPARCHRIGPACGTLEAAEQRLLRARI